MMPMRSALDSSLRRRLLFGLLAYLALLSAAVTLHGIRVNEDAEQLVWRTMLDAELDHLQERVREEPGFRWVNTDAMALYDTRGPGPVPAELRALPPGVHDDVLVDGRERAVLVREQPGHRQILSLDITDLEERETALSLTVAGSSLAAIALLALLTVWGVNRLVRPLDRLAGQIAALRPDRFGQRIELPRSATGELALIGDAVNSYVERNDRFMQRERAFIDTTSHELRTPLAVIASAVDIALQPPGLPDATRTQLQRIRRTTDDMVQLISLLLVLAKDPSRLGKASDRVALDALLLEVVDDHRHLTGDKDLTLSLGDLAPVTIIAPLPIVQAAIGNLLRNAIENSDRGVIRIELRAPATLVIEDPGHGMTPEEISALYSRLARGGAERAGAGIGLDLIARLCEHLDWSLAFHSSRGSGTVATLHMRSVSVPPDAARQPD